ncbi:FtsK/SpoIIIE domain-containing protein [Tundrisphaera lichenicola]|uniref:FtsK/SpoIIIE domain-containing protein n=1 Tax=Tundrisphaera lichenicola TaxID=2029860 RepID=UPI003EBE7E46
MSHVRTLSSNPSHESSESEPDPIARRGSSLREILRLVAERAAAEAEVERVREASDSWADREYREKKQALADRFAGMMEAARQEDEARRRGIADAAIAGDAAAKAEFAKGSRKIASDFDASREQIRADHQKAKARASGDFDAGDREAIARHAEARKPVDEALKLIESRKARLDAIFEAYRRLGLPEAPTAASRMSDRSDDSIDKVFDRLHKAEPNLVMLEGLVIPKLMKGRGYLWIIAGLFALLVAPLIWLQGVAIGLPVALAIAAVGGFFLKMQLQKLARTQVGRFYYPLVQTMIDAEALALAARKVVDQQLKEDRLKVAAARDQAIQAARQKQTKALADAEADRDERLRLINEVFARQTVEIQTKLAREMREAVDLHEKAAAELPAKNEATSKKLEDKYRAAKDEIRNRHESAWNKMADAWRAGMTRQQAEVGEIRRFVESFAPPWDDPTWSDRPPSKLAPPALRIGETRLDLAEIPGGVSSDPRLREGIETRFAFPTLAPFPDHANLLIEVPGEGRSSAVAVLQSAMFRLLTGLPAGQVKFTIVDPVGIGRNFGAFMHLADFDESLVNGQVWTDPRQIEERLAELSAHMERVTQKYLRDEYATIDEYNAVAGEVAEPYRVLVVADFPAGFDEKSAARLAAITAAGTPCGVLTMVVRDLDKPLPLGITGEDLRANASLLTWDGSTLTRADPDFDRFPLILDAPPSGELAGRLVQRAGAAARDAKRVEVPFEFIAPPANAWWTRDSRSGIDIPLGKSGATKRQHLALGKGTAQHVLVAGRTGSGKSTLLHALIVNIALNYSPDEVELYLIDFKKGVEFKVYATQGLPHASVVAIESEREFGISVLQRLDAEMRDRADRFRDAGAQDVNSYRNVPGTSPLPRILLIVDEFQEFFVEEDKLAQEAALLLDRLVRQGRAFGVHVHLGSQSLGGAYALARTTLGQMAVRIALQCSEADAHLILSEQNPAAKLLSRPGEAIYNDANGSPEGNHFFQVVWLSDARREEYLKQLHALAIERPPITKRNPIVFEGDAEADLARNPLLAPLLEAPAWPRSPRSSTAWLGDPVAIKDPTAALFRRQGGNHLLIVGQNAEAALGIMAATLIGLAAQYPLPTSDRVRSGARFVVLDGTPEDDPQVEALAKVAAILPHPIEVGTWREAPRIVAELAEEVARRQQPDADDGPEIFLLIHDLGRFRDLRRRENDFGFGDPGGDPIPSDHLATILKEGPPLGVHLVVWSDNLNNLNRGFDSQGIREFETRVLFQMSSTDSAHLLDAPHASKLGPNRALFSSEEQARLEKFRPYGLPDEGWLAKVADRFRRRSVEE